MGTKKNTEMKSTLLIFLVSALILLSSGQYNGISNRKVKTFDGNECDFGMYNTHSHKYQPEEWGSCTRNFMKKVRIRSEEIEYEKPVQEYGWMDETSYWPWCFYGASYSSDWDFCSEYYWVFYVKDDEHLINKTNPGVVEDGSKNKTYYFNYKQTGSTYSAAVKTCKSLGEGWDVASFQTLFEFKNSRYILNDKHSDFYLKSIHNLERGISPLIQTFDTFWVKNENSDFNTCLRYNRYANDVSEWRVTTEYCHATHTFVCEKDLN